MGAIIFRFTLSFINTLKCLIVLAMVLSFKPTGQFAYACEHAPGSNNLEIYHKN
ncbi:MAG: hypothetical protein AVDCRST_MAG96-3295 [uncultured Segetibacter sp.]|uniref:Uncharacterized protein n=1 Tax=uncultured Segetibacter sp. TaxID=481133 RepID=A0A6J4TM92_9BACT|nr:MAG: hypothetical protein AVDCRST_MAG96-3295 [uncultured Segetibacter sp.]